MSEYMENLHLKRIADRLWWIALWLFFIMLAQCSMSEVHKTVVRDLLNSADDITVVEYPHKEPESNER